MLHHQNERQLFCDMVNYTCIVDIELIYLLTAIGLTPGGSSTVHMYTQTKIIFFNNI